MTTLGFAAPPATVTRLDWQQAVERFNIAYAERRPSGEARALHESVDRAYNDYFGGQATAGLRELIGAAQRLLPHRSAVAGALDAVQVQVLPIISRRDRPGLLRVRLQPFYSPATTQPIDATLRIRRDATTIFSHLLHIDFTLADSITLPKPDAEPGRYAIDLLDAAGESRPLGDWFVTDASLDAQRINTARRLTTTRPADAAAWQAQVTLRSRVNLLTDSVDPNNPTALLNDPLAWSRAIHDETAAVMKGRDPYREAIGDAWRGVPAGANVIPARLYVPRSASASMPLLIVLPESTQDENDWLDRLPDRPLQRFAERTGTMVFVPRTISMLAARDSLATAIRALEQTHGLDRGHIWLLGHGVGAAAAVDLAATAPGTIARLALLGGGEFGGVSQLPPTLQLVGEFDRQFDPPRAADALDYARREGLPLEQRTRPAGHVLLVKDTLDEALAWLSAPTAASTTQSSRSAN